MIQIRKEAEDVIQGKQPKDNNVLKNAPHPVTVLTTDEWSRLVPNPSTTKSILIHTMLFRPYSRQTAVFPAPWLKEKKFWPTVGRIDDGMSIWLCDSLLWR